MTSFTDTFFMPESMPSQFGKNVYWNLSALGNIDAAYDIFAVYETRATGRINWIFDELKKDFDLTVNMALRFMTMLARKKVGGPLGGIDLPGFIKQIDQVLAESRRGLGQLQFRCAGRRAGLQHGDRGRSVEAFAGDHR